MTTTFLDLIKGCIRQDRKEYNFISVVYHVSCIVSYLSKQKNEVKSWMLTENDKRISCWNVQKEEYITVGTNTLFGGFVKYAKVNKLKFLSPSLISLFLLFNTQSLSPSLSLEMNECINYKQNNFIFNENLDHDMLCIWTFPNLCV